MSHLDSWADLGIGSNTNKWISCKRPKWPTTLILDSLCFSPKISSHPSFALIWFIYPRKKNRVWPPSSMNKGNQMYFREWLGWMPGGLVEAWQIRCSISGSFMSCLQFCFIIHFMLTEMACFSKARGRESRACLHSESIWSGLPRYLKIIIKLNLKKTFHNMQTMFSFFEYGKANNQREVLNNTKVGR